MTLQPTTRSRTDRNFALMSRYTSFHPWSEYCLRFLLSTGLVGIVYVLIALSSESKNCQMAKVLAISL